MRTPITVVPPIPGPDEQVASIALAPLEEADRLVDEATAFRDGVYAAAREAGWKFTTMEQHSRHHRGWIHTLVKRGREANSSSPSGVKGIIDRPQGAEQETS